MLTADDFGEFAPEKREERSLICRRKSTMSNPVPGSQVRTCWSCNREVWLSPSSGEMMKKNPAILYRIVCDRCAKRAYKKEGPPNVLPLTPEQIEELRRVSRARGPHEN